MTLQAEGARYVWGVSCIEVTFTGPFTRPPNDMRVVARDENTLWQLRQIENMSMRRLLGELVCRVPLLTLIHVRHAPRDDGEGNTLTFHLASGVNAQKFMEFLESLAEQEPLDERPDDVECMVRICELINIVLHNPELALHAHA